MAINYGILAPLQQNVQPVLGGSISSPTPAPSGLDQLGSGFLSGVQQGQQIKNNDLANQINSEKLTQDKLQTQDMQQKATDIKSIRDASSKLTPEDMKGELTKNIQNVRSAFYKVDPVQGALFDKTMSDMQTAAAQAKDADAKAYNSTLNARGNFYATVQEGKTDEQKAAIWNMNRDAMSPSLKKLVPENYSPQAFTVGIAQHDYEITDVLAKQQKAPAQAQSNLGKTQADINNLQDKIKAGKSAGQDTSDLETQLGQLQTVAKSQSTDEASSTLNKKQAEDWSKYKDDVAKSASNYQDINNLIEQSRTDTSGSIIPTSPMTGLLREKTTVAGDKLNKDANKLQTEIVKQMANSGIGRLDIPIVNMIQKAAPGNNRYKETNITILDKYQAANELSGNIVPNIVSQLDEAGIRDRNKVQTIINNVITDTGAFKKDGNIDLKALGNWQDSLNKQLPKSNSADASGTKVPAGRITVVSPDGVVGHIPANQLQDAIKAGYKKQQ